MAIEVFSTIRNYYVCYFADGGAEPLRKAPWATASTHVMPPKVNDDEVCTFVRTFPTVSSKCYPWYKMNESEQDGA